VVIVPVILLEACIFYFCKVPAEERVIYQEFAKEERPKGTETEAIGNKEKLETFESI
jgi:hypothetical protein